MVFMPLVLLMIFPKPDGREFLREVSVALGFLGMALLGLQTIPTSRLKFFTKAFPMDTIYTIHHGLSVFTFLVVLAHPILLRTLADREDKKETYFFYGNATWESIIFREELDALEKNLNLKLVHVLERPPEEWQGEKGFITADILGRYLPEDYQDFTYFLCGPLPMINAVEGALHTLHIPPGQVYSEQYEMA